MSPGKSITRTGIDCSVWYSDCVTPALAQTVAAAAKAASACCWVSPAVSPAAEPIPPSARNGDTRSMRTASASTVALASLPKATVSVLPVIVKTPRFSHAAPTAEKSSGWTRWLIATVPIRFPLVATPL
jgi:hypothetical protein